MKEKKSITIWIYINGIFLSEIQTEKIEYLREILRIKNKNEKTKKYKKIMEKKP